MQRDSYEMSSADMNIQTAKMLAARISTCLCKHCQKATIDLIFSELQRAVKWGKAQAEAEQNRPT